MNEGTDWRPTWQAQDEQRQKVRDQSRNKNDSNLPFHLTAALLRIGMNLEGLGWAVNGDWRC